MPRDTRSRFERLRKSLEPSVRGAFLQAIADVTRTADQRALERALERGDINGALSTLRLGPEFYAPLQAALTSTYGAGGTYAIDSLPKRNPRTRAELVVRFQGQHPRAVAWAQRNAGQYITELSDGVRQSAREVLARGIAENRPPDQLARDLVGRVRKGSRRRSGGVIGLDTRRAEWLESYRRKLIAEGRPADQITRMTHVRANKLLRQRGQAIARTETIGALNAGRFEGMRQITESGVVAEDAVTKSWDATGDALTRPAHAQMEGQTVKLNEPFVSPTGARLMHVGDPSLGAGPEDVANCRCYTKISIDWFADLD